jgi:YihY family inner membrane protein
VVKPLAGPFSKFFADRGTHLAAMIAYFALLSFLPLTFLALALLGLFGRVDESSLLVRELAEVFPQRSVDSIVREVRRVQENASTLGIVGGALLLWSSLSLFSALESAFNIVYHRPNRPFLRGKALATLYMLTALLVLFAGLVIGFASYRFADRWVPGIAGDAQVGVAVSILLSTGAAFLFLVTAYYRLTNERLSWREVLPGAALGAVALQATFQLLPLFLVLTNQLVALQALGVGALLLVWLYVMANVIVFGAEVNWWVARGRREEEISGLA